MARVVYKAESYAIVGACFEVYNEMGPGFLESVYQECLAMEMAGRSIPFRAHLELRLAYKTDSLRQTYRPDFVCYDKIIVEIKSVKDPAERHSAQVHDYLRATRLRLGLLVNFRHYPRLQYRRIVY